MLRISVFTLLGAQIMLDLNPLLLLVEFLFALLVFVVRPIFVNYLARGVRDETGFEGFTLLQLAAPRGIASAAMAPIAALAVGDTLIMNIVFMVIFFSVLFSTITANLVSSGKALAIKEWMDRLKGRGKSSEPAPAVETDSEDLEPPMPGDEDSF